MYLRVQCCGIDYIPYSSDCASFLDLCEFFKNRGSTLETSDLDFYHLLDEFFHIAQKHFFEKYQSIKTYFEVILLKSMLTYF